MYFSEYVTLGYESHLKWLRIQTNTIKKYEQHARAEGMAEGETKGEAKGRLDKKQEMAKQLIRLGVALEIIVDATGLSRAAIEAMKASRE